MTSLSEDIISSVTPSLDLQDGTGTDNELALDTPLPDLSPSVSPSPIAVPVRARLDSILPQGDDVIAKRKKKRKVVKKSSVQLDTASLPTWSKPLPPLETDSSSPRVMTPNEPPPLVPIQSVLQVSYEPLGLLSEEDLASNTENTILGNPISTNSPPSQFLMKSEKAYFERQDGRFIPVTNQDSPPAEPITQLSCPNRHTFSRVSLARICNSVFYTLGIASHSLLVGITLWHAVIVFTLASYTGLDLNLIMNLSKLSLPSHNLFYFLSTLTVVYLADKVDLLRFSKKDILEIFHRRQLTILFNLIALILTSISLILTLSLMYIDLQIHYISLPYSADWVTLWTDIITNSTSTTTTTTTTTSCPVYTVGLQSYYPVDVPVSYRADVFKSLLLVRAILCACGWVMVVWCPSRNRWYLYVTRVMKDES